MANADKKISEEIASSASTENQLWTREVRTKKYGSYIIVITCKRTIEWYAEKRHWQRSERESMVCIIFDTIQLLQIYDFFFFWQCGGFAATASIAWQTKSTRKKKQRQQQQRSHTIYTMRATNDGQENERDIFASEDIFLLFFSSLSLLVSLGKKREIKTRNKNNKRWMTDDTIMVLRLCVKCYHLITSIVVFLHEKT